MSNFSNTLRIIHSFLVQIRGIDESQISSFGIFPKQIFQTRVWHLIFFCAVRNCISLFSIGCGKMCSFCCTYSESSSSFKHGSTFQPSSNLSKISMLETLTTSRFDGCKRYSRIHRLAFREDSNKISRRGLYRSKQTSSLSSSRPSG